MTCSTPACLASLTRAPSSSGAGRPGAAPLRHHACPTRGLRCWQPPARRAEPRSSGSATPGSKLTPGELQAQKLAEASRHGTSCAGFAPPRTGHSGRTRPAAPTGPGTGHRQPPAPDAPSPADSPVLIQSGLARLAMAKMSAARKRHPEMMVSLSISGGSRLRPAPPRSGPGPGAPHSRGSMGPALPAAAAPRTGPPGRAGSEPGGRGGAGGCSGREPPRLRAAPGRAGLTGEAGLCMGAGPAAAIPGAAIGEGRGLGEGAWRAPGCCLRRGPPKPRGGPCPEAPQFPPMLRSLPHFVFHFSARPFSIPSRNCCPCTGLGKKTN